MSYSKNTKQQRETMVGDEARQNLLTALSFIAEAVGSTMGPGGRPFGFDKLGTDMRLSASFSKDGLTVLKSLGFDDPAWQAVLQYAKQAASHSVLASGDGTTSTLVLANAVALAVSHSEDKSPQAAARQIEAEAAAAIGAIRSEAIKSKEAVRCVAMTSTNGDAELTDVVLDAIENSGAFGSVIVEKNPASSVRYRIVRQDGYSNCSGYNYNQTFALSASSDSAASKPIQWQDPKVLIWNGSLISEAQIQPILSAWNETLNDPEGPRNLVILAYDISEEVANKLLVVNRTMAKHGVAVFVVKPKLTAEVNSGLQVLRDIAAFCGIDDDKIVDGGNYKELSAKFFGVCGKVKIAPGGTMFLGRAANHWVEKRVQQNQSIVDEARSQFDKQITSIRNAELAEGLVKVEVGGGHLPELQERADRFDDASKAAQSCMWHGAVPGGGLSYIRAGQIAKVSPALQGAFESIHKTVLSNYGSGVVVAMDLDGKQGYRLSKEKGIEFGNAVELGVLDACETVCAVIKNGVALGVNIAIIGGYSFRDQASDVQDYE